VSLTSVVEQRGEVVRMVKVAPSESAMRWRKVAGCMLIGKKRKQTVTVASRLAIAVPMNVATVSMHYVIRWSLRDLCLAISN
jgi:hypothetical protein